MPFLFWRATWFGLPLSDPQIAQYLADREHPRKQQHALSQIADRMFSNNPATRESAKKWYPQVRTLSENPVDELRITAAWVMGQDNTVPEFRDALLRLLGDRHPMVRRNAALSLVRSGNSAGLPVIRAMLEPFTVAAARSGRVKQRLKLGEAVNPGTLLGRLQSGQDDFEVRCQVSGALERWIAPDGADVSAADPLLTVAPSPKDAGEALRALYLIGAPEDLIVIDRYLGSAADLPESVRRQAELTRRAIRARAGEPSLLPKTEP